MTRSISKRCLFALIALAAMALPCFATELAVLRNGFSIKHERRKVIGTNTRLYTSRDGSNYVDVPTADIEHFEAAPDDPAPAVTLPLSTSPTFQNSSQKTTVTSAISRPQLNLDQVVNVASERYRLDPDLVNSVIKAESGFNVRAVSPKGAQGLMQLMPGTASQLGVSNTFDAQANVEGGTKYLRELLERYNFDLVKALAAYNAGPQRVEQYGGVPPYYETRAYVARIVRDFNKKKAPQNGSVAGKSVATKNLVARNSTTRTPSTKASPQKRTASQKTTAPSQTASVRSSAAGVQAKASQQPSE